LILGALAHDHPYIVGLIGLASILISFALFFWYIPTLVASREFASKFPHLASLHPPSNPFSRIIPGLKRCYRNLVNGLRNEPLSSRIILALYIGTIVWVPFQAFSSTNHFSSSPSSHNTLGLIGVYWFILIFFGAPIWIIITSRRSIRKQLAQRQSRSAPTLSSEMIARLQQHAITAKRLKYMGNVRAILVLLCIVLAFAAHHFQKQATKKSPNSNTHHTHSGTF
ncbi:MAG TPA: hypothetical protein VGG19_20155, partial [Tepidisphaeraceae bacterium]